MSTFVFLYHAPASPSDAAPPSPEQMEAVMQQWGAWAGSVGDRMVDFGAPLAGGIRVSADGTTTPSSREVSGYTILQAADLDEALTLARNHPHLAMPGGCEIEVHEAQPVPGM